MLPTSDLEKFKYLLTVLGIGFWVRQKTKKGKKVIEMLIMKNKNSYTYVYYNLKGKKIDN